MNAYSMQNFKEKTILVTGATSGIGKACVECFVRAGAHVIATGRRKHLLQELAVKYPGQITPILLDVTDKAAVRNALSSIKTIDVLVNNAGLALGLERADKTDLEDWERMVQTNINGVLYVTHAMLPDMVKRNNGHIINIGSIAGNYAYPGGNTYAGTKAFINHFSLNLRADLIGTTIRVTCIEPGMVETEFSKVRFKGDTEKAAGVYAGVQALTAEDIAQSVFWCASLPAHVNINIIEVMPTMQAPAGLAVMRD